MSNLPKGRTLDTPGGFATAERECVGGESRVSTQSGAEEDESYRHGELAAPETARARLTRRYEALLSHYGLVGQKIQAGKANQNGDVEQRHHRFKETVDQALMLRGSRDFESREAAMP